MEINKEKADKLPLICRMCKAGIVKYFCKVCPAVSVDDLPMSSEKEAHALNMQTRVDMEKARRFSLECDWNGTTIYEEIVMPAEPDK
jgi:hypothetical protein